MSSPTSPNLSAPRGGEGKFADASVIIIGIGNVERGDDGVGRVVARLVRERAPGLRVIEHDGEAASLLEAMRGTERVWLIDAACSGAPAGTIHRIDCADGVPLPACPVSSHGFGVAEAIGLGRALGTLPPQCVVYAIEGVNFAVGQAVSAAVSHAADVVAAELTRPPLSSRDRWRRRVPAPDRR